MGLLKDLAIVIIIVFLIIMGLGAAHVTALNLQTYWHNFWSGYHVNLPFGL